MPFKTEHGTHYHLNEGCCGATIPCGTKGLTPCGICVSPRKTASHGAASPTAEGMPSPGLSGDLEGAYRIRNLDGSAIPSPLLKDRIRSFMEMVDRPEELGTLEAMFSIGGNPITKDEFDEILLTADAVLDAVEKGDPSAMPQRPDDETVTRILSERIEWMNPPSNGGTGQKPPSASSTCPYPSWLVPDKGSAGTPERVSPHRTPEKRLPDRWRECHVKGGVMSCPDHCEAAKRGILGEIAKAAKEPSGDSELMEDLSRAQEAIGKSRELGIRRHVLLSEYKGKGMDARARIDEIRKIDEELRRLDKVIQKRHGARQNHGFVWEGVCGSVFGNALRKMPGYTDKDDAFLRLPGGAEVACSMKSRKEGGEIDFADMKRILESSEPVVLFLQTRNEKGDWDIHTVLYPDGLSVLWGSADVSAIRQSMEDFMRHETEVAGDALHSHSFDDRHKEMLEEYTSGFAKDMRGKGCVLNPRLKRDHKKQYRMQCAVSNADLSAMIAKGTQIGKAVPMPDFVAMRDDDTKRRSFLSSIEQGMPATGRRPVMTDPSDALS